MKKPPMASPGASLTIPVNSEDLAAAKEEARRLRIPLRSLLTVVADRAVAALPATAKYRQTLGAERLSLALPERLEECLSIIEAKYRISRSGAVRWVLAEAGRRTA